MPTQEKRHERILGIDPGYDRLGIAIVENSKVLFSKCFETDRKDNIQGRLFNAGTEIAKIIQEYKPSSLAIETLFITKNQKTAMRVSEMRGIIIYEAMRAGLGVHEYSPMQIKLAITSDGKSDKKMMKKMVGLLTGEKNTNPTKKKDDEYDAIAVALTHEAIIHNSILLPK